MKKKLFFTFLLLLTLNIFMIGGASVPAGIELAIIINNGNPTDKLDPAEVKDYWLKRGMKKKWKTSTVVLPVDRKVKCPEKELFYSKILRLSVDDVESYFAAKQYQGAENPPEKLATDKEIIAYVSEHPGAIGFVNKSSISDDVKGGIKIACVIAQ
jgi:ABC-type phosphate transport system substrate-binding protein